MTTNAQLYLNAHLSLAVFAAQPSRIIGPLLRMELQSIDRRNGAQDLALGWSTSSRYDVPAR